MSVLLRFYALYAIIIVAMAVVEKKEGEFRLRGALLSLAVAGIASSIIAFAIPVIEKAVLRNVTGISGRVAAAVFMVVLQDFISILALVLISYLIRRKITVRPWVYVAVFLFVCIHSAFYGFYTYEWNMMTDRFTEGMASGLQLINLKSRMGRVSNILSITPILALAVGYLTTKREKA